MEAQSFRYPLPYAKGPRSPDGGGCGVIERATSQSRGRRGLGLGRTNGRINFPTRIANYAGSIESDLQGSISGRHLARGIFVG